MSIKAQIQYLAELQVLEIDIKTVNRLLAEIPEELEGLARQRSEFNLTIERVENEVDTLQKQYRSWEGESQSISDKIAKEEEKLTQQPLPKKRVGDFSFSVPLDINAKIHLDRISLSADDRRSERRLDIDNGSIHFDMPSLYHIPVTLNVDADVRIDRREALPCRIAVSVKKTGSIPKEIKPENLLIEVQGAVPGVEFSTDGDLGKEGLKSKINVSLAKPFFVPS